MSEMETIRTVLKDVIGEEGCGETCEDADIFRDEEGWKMRMCSFVGSWKLGKTVEEATKTIRELGSMGFGLS